MALFESARFAGSAYDPTEWPTFKGPRGEFLPEIVCVGRSNVGKSTFINSLFQTKGLARTSSTPGTTRRVQFYITDEKIVCADVPGYGYSRAGKEEVSAWNKLTDAYLQTRSSLKLLLLLVDSRRGMSEQDRVMLAWAQQRAIECLIIYTKTDKLSARERDNALRSFERNGTALPLLFSHRDREARRRIIQEIQRRLP